MQALPARARTRDGLDRQRRVAHYSQLGARRVDDAGFQCRAAPS
jgi:hypothetical protein